MDKSRDWCGPAVKWPFYSRSRHANNRAAATRVTGGVRRATGGLLATLAALLAAAPAAADIINVPGDQPTIQAGIDAAVDGDEVVVAPGTYFEAINFNGKAITVRSASGNPADTIINGGPFNTHVVQCVSGEGPSTVFSGFTITGGNPYLGVVADHGGGMLNSGSSPMVTNCVFSGNLAFLAGGGMCNLNGSNPTVTDCTFSGNTAQAIGGGGMYNSNSSPTVTNCRFANNSASASSGGGMYNAGASPTVSKCTFSANSGLFAAGGMYNTNSSPTVTNCEFRSNRTDFDGGGMWNGGGSPTVTNCLFSENLATDIDGRGAGMFSSGSSPTVANCTFTENIADTYFSGYGEGGGMWNSGGSPTVTSCVFSGNSADTGSGVFGAATVTYSNVQDGYPGAGNINADPRFVDPAGGDYRLSFGSPCIDAGNNTAVPADVADLDGDGDTAEATPFDLNGNLRFVDDLDTSDSGNGAAPIVDIGAYEFFVPLNTDYTDAVVASGPLLYWSFEESGLDPAEDRVTQLPANALVPQQGAIRGPSLAGLGMAASFNGTRDFQQTQPRFLGTSLSIGGPTVFDHYAAEMWVKLNEASGLQYVLEGSDGGTYNSPALIQGFSTNGGQPALEYFSGVRTGELGPTTLNDNQWHHIVVEVEVAAGMHTIYIDGQLSVQADGANPWRLPYLGVGATAYWDGFHGTNGLIDELAFYDLPGGSVTGADIARHYLVLFPPAFPADLDGDGDVDVDDFGIFAGCMMGPDVAHPGGCGTADLDGDGDVDMHDLARFQQAYTGP